MRIRKINSILSLLIIVLFFVTMTSTAAASDITLTGTMQNSSYTQKTYTTKAYAAAPQGAANPMQINVTLQALPVANTAFFPTQPWSASTLTNRTWLSYYTSKIGNIDVVAVSDGTLTWNGSAGGQSTVIESFDLRQMYSVTALKGAPPGSATAPSMIHYVGDYIFSVTDLKNYVTTGDLLSVAPIYTVDWLDSSYSPSITYYGYGGMTTQTISTKVDPLYYTGSSGLPEGANVSTPKLVIQSHKCFPTSWKSASSVTLSAFYSTGYTLGCSVPLIVDRCRIEGSPALNCSTADVKVGTILVDKGSSMSTYSYDAATVTPDIATTGSGSSMVTTTTFKSTSGGGSVVVPPPIEGGTPDPTPGGSFTWEGFPIEELAEALKEALKGLVISGGGGSGGSGNTIIINPGNGGNGGEGGPGGDGGDANVDFTVDWSKFPSDVLAKAIADALGNKYPIDVVAKAISSAIADSDFAKNLAQQFQSIVDTTAPAIQVKRSTTAPATSVTLTATALDTDGKGMPADGKCISFNGEEYVASGSTKTFTENQVVTIYARDKSGNISSISVPITNIDLANPSIDSISQNSYNWTSLPVNVTVKATDDQKLDAKAYKYEFTPNSGGSKKTIDWTASTSFQATENGILTVTVKDAVGKTTTSEPYYVSNIDKTPPKLTWTFDVKDGETVTSEHGVTVTAMIEDVLDPVTNESSGLSATPIIWDSQAGEWSAKPTYTFHETGVHQVKVRDAVGNISDWIDINIPTSLITPNGPQITGFPGAAASGSTAKASPVTLTATAVKSPGGADLPDKCYSWDEGKTWTSFNTFEITENGDYTVMVRDVAGNITEQTYKMTSIDPYPPTASMTLYKGLPNDWNEWQTSYTTVNYCWKIKIEATDVGSRVVSFKTLWDNQMHDASELPFLVDVLEPGLFGVEVYDEAGNMTYVEKYVSDATVGSLSNSVGGTNNNIDIRVPQTGSAGEFFQASLTDMVWSKYGGYNKATGIFLEYPANMRGIPVNVIVQGTYNNYLTGYIIFDNVRYDLHFGTLDGPTVWRSNGEEVTAVALIPAENINKDLKNERIQVVVQEWRDSACTSLAKEGSGTLYTSTQNSEPTINWTYNEATDEITITATSTVGGISEIEVEVDGVVTKYPSSPVKFKVDGASSIKITAKDNCNNQTSITLDGTNLPLLGNAGGSIPTTELAVDNDVASYHVSNRSADIYIIGGTRGNTNSAPSGDVFDMAGVG